MWTPDEEDICPPIYPVKHICSMIGEGESEGFAVVRGKNEKDHEISAF
jgi:hypothetical protein